MAARLAGVQFDGEMRGETTQTEDNFRVVKPRRSERALPRDVPPFAIKGEEEREEGGPLLAPLLPLCLRSIKDRRTIKRTCERKFSRHEPNKSLINNAQEKERHNKPRELEQRTRLVICGNRRRFNARPRKKIIREMSFLQRRVSVISQYANLRAGSRIRSRSQLKSDTFFTLSIDSARAVNDPAVIQIERND